MSLKNLTVEFHRKFPVASFDIQLVGDFLIEEQVSRVFKSENVSEVARNPWSEKGQRFNNIRLAGVRLADEKVNPTCVKLELADGLIIPNVNWDDHAESFGSTPL